VQARTATTKGRALDGMLLVAYAGVVIFGLAVHEPWADEAQVWVLARESPLFKLVFRDIAYIGHPALIYLWAAVPAKLGLPYVAAKILCFLVSIAFAWLLLRTSPFPRALNGLLLFSYFLAYQYAILLRPYLLLPPLFVLLAAHDRAQFREPFRHCLILCFLANTVVHGYLVAFWMGLFWGRDLFARRGELASAAVRRNVLALAFLAGMLGFVALYMRRPPDLFWHRGYGWPGWGRLSTHGLYAFNMPLSEFGPLSYTAATIGLLWLGQRRLALRFLAVYLSFALFAATVVHKPWHEGCYVLVWLLFIWIGWWRQPGSKSRCIRACDFRQPWPRRGAAAALVAVLAVQVYWSAAVLVNDWRRPYSAGRETAAYIRDLRADGTPVLYGSGFWLTSVLPYFDDAVFANFTYADPAFRVFLKGDTYRDSTASIVAGQPDYFVAARLDKPPAPWYELIRNFEAHLLWKNRVYETNDIRIYRRSWAAAP